MSDQAQEPQAAEAPAPGRSYRSVHVVADTLEHDGFVVIGAIVDGALVPIAHQDAGLVDGMKQRWNELGGVKVDDLAETAAAGLSDRVAALERGLQALQAKVDPSSVQGGGGEPPAAGGESSPTS